MYVIPLNIILIRTRIPRGLKSAFARYREKKLRRGDRDDPRSSVRAFRAYEEIRRVSGAAVCAM